MSDDAKSCSFCGKSQDDVLTLIAGPAAHICETCVVTCVGILEDNGVWPSPPVRWFRAVRHWLGGRRESN